MEIVFGLSHVFERGSNPAENATTLRLLLESLIAINRDYLKRHPATPALYRSGVRYRRTVVWDSIPNLYRRQYGDCKSLTCALVAEYRHRGIPCRPVFRFMSRDDGSNLFHILAELDSGKFEDPSKKLGMLGSEWRHFQGS